MTDAAFGSRAFVVASLAFLALAVAGNGFAGKPRSERSVGARSHLELANGCFRLRTVDQRRFVAISGDGYRGPEGETRGPAVFHLKPTGRATYLLHDQRRMLLTAVSRAEIGRDRSPAKAAEWLLRRLRGPAFSLTSRLHRQRIGVDPGSGRLAFAGRRGVPPARFEFLAASRCRRYPEAGVGARGEPFAGTKRGGRLLGFADVHMHVTANLRAGGRVISGLPFHRYGIREALGHDDRHHGPDGSLDITGNLLRDGTPTGTHDTHGWPTFAGWPVHDTYTHQQAYYVWIKRVWKAGLRLLVAQAVEDEALCELQPLKSHSCDETETVRLAVHQLRHLQAYVDAQAGGRGRGWFRIVTDPRQARRVIRRGKLAVVIGMETSSPFGCSEFQGEPQCTRADVDRVLNGLRRLGVRSVFIAHWIDNAFGGAALQGGAQGDFIGTFELATTGHPFSTEPCGEAGEAEGECNAKGLTPLGRYLIRRMIDLGMLIEADHLSQNARRTVFEIAERNRYPLVSSHTGTGGEWTPDQLRRLCAVGGVAAATPEIAPALVEKVLRLRRSAGGRRCGIALGSDTGGFAALPGPRTSGAPLPYPFRSYDGRVQFVRQRSGQRAFDLNRDGVAHYGLFADLLADMRRQRGGRAALRALFGSADAYLRMWERAARR